MSIENSATDVPMTPRSKGKQPAPFIVPSSIEDEIFNVLRGRIISGQLLPGAPLTLAELSAEFGISSMPIRGALIRLESEGLVTRLSRRTATVSPLRLEDLEEIQALRVGVEGSLAYYGAPHLLAGDLASMQAHVAHLQRSVRMDSVADFQTEEWILHKICFERASRARLLHLAVGYRQRADRYLRLVFQAPHGLADSLEFQERFVRACADRDGKSAEAVLAEAFRWTISRFCAVEGESGESKDHVGRQMRYGRT